MRKWLERFKQSAIDTFLKSFWVAVGGLLVTVALTAWAVIRGINAEVLDRLIGGVIGIALVVVANVIASEVRALRSRALARSVLAATKKGFLDFMVDQARASKESNRCLRAIGAEVRGIGAAMHKATPKVQENLQGGAIKKVRRRTRRLAARISARCAQIDRHLVAYNENVELWRQSQIGCLEWEAKKPNNSESDLRDLRAATVAVLDSVRATTAQQEDFKRVAVNLTGVSQDMNAATVRLNTTIDATIAAFRKTEALCTSTLAIVDQMISRTTQAASANKSPVHSGLA
jgi:hypothetical protein